ncbi:hypothetical protein [Parapedobacter sp. 2B3]|uniref:hypothetical protein n=1 Tax=Parapedobacter sp. 2B3 TaxID=3342381 RepID=UPI0035B5A546
MGTKLTLTVEESVIKENLSPELKKLMGAVKLPHDFDRERELREYFENKHVKNRNLNECSCG